MGERELREKYGGKLAKAINRAIRAEIPEGNAALDTLTQLAGPAWRSGWAAKNGKPTPEAAAYFKHKKEVVDQLEARIRKQWNIPPEKMRVERPARRSSQGAKRSPRPTRGRTQRKRP